ncbi:unnamed protein product [Cuscuta campestris]|uniref:Uncharacterized protein n=1 Tax=Cuscuta campestris TaxID=132261 RepID=A0A484M1N5_9ASTE|nr:unnamed protein product [Cuscuta campestris]
MNNIFSRPLTCAINTVDFIGIRWTVYTCAWERVHPFIEVIYFNIGIGKFTSSYFSPSSIGNSKKHRNLHAGFARVPVAEDAADRRWEEARSFCLLASQASTTFVPHGLPRDSFSSPDHIGVETRLRTRRTMVVRPKGPPPSCSVTEKIVGFDFSLLQSPVQVLSPWGTSIIVLPHH